jgi:ATP-dependent helicase/nuclease subunit A
MANFLIYKSSAGSGKTYTLVKEYLKIVLKNPSDFRHTLAVTFTNKAADEMKSRIVEKLICLAEGKDKIFEDELKAEGVDADIPARSKQVLDNILHRYSYFSVMTIDSFFHSVIRSFARELRLHIGYNLEMDTDSVMTKIVDELLDETGSNPELTAYLEDYIYSRMDDEKGWTIDSQVEKLGGEIFKERYWERKNRLNEDITESRTKMKEFISQIFGITKQFESEMTGYSKSAREIFARYKLKLEDFPYGKGGFMNYLINKIADKSFEPGDRVREVLLHPGKWLKKDSQRNVIEAVNTGLNELLEKAVEYYDKNYRTYYTARELTGTIYELGVFKDLLDKLKEYRDENRLMLISDTNNILQKVISTESSPFVYEKTGNIYKHFLVDEFQDTSTFQWGNLLPLIINSLGENNFSMVVGDVKQSIYRWRNGNMKLLLEKIYSDLENYRSVLEDRNLIENRRSRKEIIHFNNIFFSKAGEVLSARAKELFGEQSVQLINKSYADVEQKTDFAKKAGYVNISFIDDEEEDITVQEKAQSTVLNILDTLKNENVPMADILVLVRKNNEGSDIAELLNENGYKVVSNDSLFVSHSPKVKLLVNVLKYMIDNQNYLARAEILYNYLLINDRMPGFDKLFTEVTVDGSSLFYNEMPEEFIKKQGKEQGKGYRLNPILNNLSLYELIENLIRIFRLNNGPDSYLLRFQDAVLEYLNDDTGDISGFLDWWEENQWNYSIVIPAQEDAVRIMTIHKAKGLQSPVVIIPYANWNIDIDGTKDLIWVSSNTQPFDRSTFLVKGIQSLKQTYFEKDYLEEAVLNNIDNLNLLYVAFTRASERLYAVVPERGDNKYRIDKLIRSVIDADEELKLKYNPETKVFETGDKNKYEPARKDNPLKSQKMLNYISSDWYHRIIIRPKHNSLKLVKEKDFSDKTSRGNILHEIMSFINTKDDIDNALDCVQNEGMITQDIRDKLKEEVEGIINIKEAQDWFSGKWEVKSEAEILIPNDKPLRPDRVMIKDGCAVIVDYKTGIEKEDEHRKQLEKYASALSKAGYSSVEKYILYTADKKVVKY